MVGMDYRIKDETAEVVAALNASGTGSTWEITVEEALRKAFEAGRRTAAEKIERVIGGYPGNDAERPRAAVGEYLNDWQWAAQIARTWPED